MRARCRNHRRNSKKKLRQRAFYSNPICFGHGTDLAQIVHKAIMMIRVNQPLILTENSPHRTLHSSFHSIYVIHLQCHHLQSFLWKSHFVLIVIWTNFLFGVFKYLLDNNVYLPFFSSSNSKMRFKCCPMLASFNSRSHSRLALWFVLRLISN